MKAMKKRGLAAALALVPLAASSCLARADSFTSYFDLTHIANQTYLAAEYSTAVAFADSLSVWLQVPANFAVIYTDFGVNNGTVANAGWSVSLTFASPTSLTLSSLNLSNWSGYPANVVKIAASGTFQVVPGPLVGAGLLPLFGIGALALRRRKALS